MRSGITERLSISFFNAAIVFMAESGARRSSEMYFRMLRRCSRACLVIFTVYVFICLILQLGKNFIYAKRIIVLCLLKACVHHLIKLRCVIVVLTARSMSHQKAVIIGLEFRQELTSGCSSSSVSPIFKAPIDFSAPTLSPYPRANSAIFPV